MIHNKQEVSEVLIAIDLLLNNGYSVVKRFSLVEKITNKEIEQDKISRLKNLSTLFELDTRSRKRDLVYKRHFFCSFCRTFFNLTLQQIGYIIRRDHATALNSIRQHEELKSYADYKDLNKDLNKQLKEIFNYYN